MLAKKFFEFVYNKIDSAVVFARKQFAFSFLFFKRKFKKLKHFEFQRKIYTAGFSIGRKTDCVKMQAFFCKEHLQTEFCKIKYFSPLHCKGTFALLFNLLCFFLCRVFCKSNSFAC